MILDILESTALLLALCWLHGAIPRMLGERRRAAELASGLLFGGICIVGMLNPVYLSQGLILDARSAVLSMAALFGGPLVGGVAALLAGSFRLGLGGESVFAGVANVLISLAFGLAYRFAVQRGWVRLGLRQLLLFGVLLHLPLSVLLLVEMARTLPQVEFSSMFWPAVLSMLVLFALATALLGWLLLDMQQQRKAAIALQQSEARLRAIATALPDLLLVLDEEGRYLEVISPDDTLLYRPVSQLLGKRLHEVLSTSEAEFFVGLIRRTLTSDQTQVLEYRMHTQAGPRVFEGRAQRLDTPISDKRAVLFLARDISARVQAEQEKRIAAIAFESQQGILIADVHSRILRVNQAFCRITGYSAEEVVGQHTRILGSGRHDAAFYQSLWESINERGCWEGEIWNRRKDGEIYPEWLVISAVRDEEGRVSNYVATLTDISERKAAEEQIRNLAFYDPLTALPNRRLLLDRLQQALGASARNGRYGALMFIDLDNFKNINDLHGHQVGDQLLLQVAERLTQVVRGSDTVSRLGGDEFVLMLEDLERRAEQAAAQVEQIGEKVLAALQTPFQVGNLQLRSSGSIGAVLFNDGIFSAGELMKRADLSMYEAKGAGKNGLRFFDPNMQESVSNRLRLEEDIRRGLAAGEFVLHVQPQISQHSGVTGGEALVRWQHPHKGLLAPGHFIEVAERAGLLQELDFQVLQQACGILANWAPQPVLSQLSLAVNLSARLLYQADFVERLLQLLERSGVDPRRLKLELTEVLLLDDMPEAIARIKLLKEHGIRFSIDDFGTGYSSLAYLQQLPIDQLKIDQSFVRTLDENASSLAIVRAICALGASLELAVIAEGVETDAQRQVLLANGCHNFQGYLFSRPLPLAEFEQLVISSTAAD